MGFYIENSSKFLIEIIYETGIIKEKDIYLKILNGEIQCCEICLQAIWSLEKYFKTKLENKITTYT